MCPLSIRMKPVYNIPYELTSSIKDMDMKQGIVTGYFSAFNNVDSDGDVILPGAFRKSIQENGPNSPKPRIKHLLNHNTNLALGALQSLVEDRKGLAYESQIGSHELGEDFLKMVDSGLITEHSIGFQVMKWRSSDTLTYECWGETCPVRELQELKLWEGSSLTCWGANEDTPITGVKSMTPVKAAERCELLTKAIANGTFTDRTFQYLIAELKNIQQAFQAYGTTQPEHKATTEPNDEEELLAELKSINKSFQS